MDKNQLAIGKSGRKVWDCCHEPRPRFLQNDEGLFFVCCNCLTILADCNKEKVGP